MVSEREGQTRPVGLSDVDALAIADVDNRHPATIDEHPVRRIIGDREPPALLKAQQQVRASNERMGDTHVGAEVTSDHYIMT